MINHRLKPHNSNLVSGISVNPLPQT